MSWETFKDEAENRLDAAVFTHLGFGINDPQAMALWDVAVKVIAESIAREARACSPN